MFQLCNPNPARAFRDAGLIAHPNTFLITILNHTGTPAFQKEIKNEKSQFSIRYI